MRKIMGYMTQIIIHDYACSGDDKQKAMVTS